VVVGDQARDCRANEEGSRLEPDDLFKSTCCPSEFLLIGVERPKGDRL